MPPSSRGLGRSPFKAKTGVRISLGAPYHKPARAFFLHKSNQIRDVHDLFTAKKATKIFKNQKTFFKKRLRSHSLFFSHDIFFLLSSHCWNFLVLIWINMFFHRIFGIIFMQIKQSANFEMKRHKTKNSQQPNHTCGKPK